MSDGKNGFTLWQRVQIHAIAFTGWLFVWILGSTIRYTQEGRDRVDGFDRSGQPMIFSFWHNQILLATYLFRFHNVVVITSRHFDGEYIARIIHRFGYGSVRGSSTRGAVGALLELKRCISVGKHVAFTIDGPRGPRYRVKPGPVLLARKTGAPILPLHIEPEKYWELKSWDRFRIPVPFTKALVRFGDPIFLSDDHSDDDVAVEGLQKAMERNQRETFSELHGTKGASSDQTIG